MSDSSKYLNLEGLRTFTNKLKTWTSDKIDEKIAEIPSPQLAKVATTGSYNDLVDKTHEVSVTSVVLDNSDVQFAYRSADFNQYTQHGGLSPYYNYDQGEEEPNCQIISNYYYNVTFDGTLYENLLANKVLFRNSTETNSSYCGIGNRALFTQPASSEITAEEEELPFYIVSSGGDSDYSPVWLFATTEGEHTFTVQCTGEKVSVPKALVSMGVYTAGASSMEEFENMIGAGTLPLATLPDFDFDKDYSIEINGITYTSKPKRVFIADLGGNAYYFGSEAIIRDILVTIGGVNVDFPEYTEGDFAALFVPADPNSPCMAFTATRQDLELSQEISEAANMPVTAPISIQFDTPNIYADMYIAQMSDGVPQLENVDPFSNALYIDMLASGSSEPTLDPQTLTLIARDVDRQDFAVGYLNNIYIKNTSLEYNSNGDTFVSSYTFDDIFYDYDGNNHLYFWKDGDNIRYIGNPSFNEDIYNLYDFSNYTEDQLEEINKCNFLLKAECIENFDSKFPTYNFTLYTKYHGLHSLPLFDDVPLIFDTAYSIVYDEYIGLENIDSVFENYNYVPTDWYRCLDDNYKLKKNQKIYVKLGDIEYNLIVKEDPTTGFTYAGNPEFLPSEFFVYGLPAKPEIPFIVCSHHKAYGNKWPEEETNSRYTTRIYFNPEEIEEVREFLIKYDFNEVIKEFDYEVIEPSLPQIDWNETDETSKSHILNRTHFDDRKGLAEFKYSLYFHKSGYDDGYSTEFPSITYDSINEIGITLKYNGTSFLNKKISSSIMTSPTSYYYYLQTSDMDLTIQTRDVNNEEHFQEISLYLDESLVPTEYLNDRQNITLDFTLNEDDLVLSSIPCSNSIEPTPSNFRLNIDNEIHSAHSMYISSIYIKDLPFESTYISGGKDGIYTVEFNGKKYQLKVGRCGYRSQSYFYIGNRVYMQGYIYYDKDYSHWSGYVISSADGGEYKDLKFAVQLFVKRCPGNIFKVTGVTIHYDNEIASEFTYPNPKEFKISFGEIKTLDDKYIPDTIAKTTDIPDKYEFKDIKLQYEVSSYSPLTYAYNHYMVDGVLYKNGQPAGGETIYMEAKEWSPSGVYTINSTFTTFTAENGQPRGFEAGYFYTFLSDGAPKPRTHLIFSFYDANDHTKLLCSHTFVKPAFDISANDKGYVTADQVYNYVASASSNVESLSESDINDALGLPNWELKRAEIFAYSNDTSIDSAEYVLKKTLNSNEEYILIRTTGPQGDAHAYYVTVDEYYQIDTWGEEISDFYVAATPTEVLADAVSCEASVTFNDVLGETTLSGIGAVTRLVQEVLGD